VEGGCQRHLPRKRKSFVSGEILHFFLANEVSVRVARGYIFETKNFNFGNFWRALELQMLVHFMPIF
jgi:hypothetical protein